MSEKNIDRIFKDSLADFKAVPDEVVWDAIEASLDKKKSRKLIPFWWFGSAAAVAIIVIALAIPYFTDENIPAVTNSEINVLENVDTIEKKQVPVKIYNTPNAVVTAESEVGTSEVKNNQEEERKYQPKRKAIKNKALVVAKSNEDKVVSKNLEKNGGVASNSSESKYENNELEIPSNNISASKIVAIEERINGDSQQNQPNNKGAIVKNEIKIDDVLNDTLSTKKSIFEEIEKQQQEKEAVANVTPENKWSVGPNIAPVYFSTSGNQSAISSGLNSNAKVGGVNMSYGVSVAYTVGSKLRVRSGINKVDYGYETKDVNYALNAQGSVRIEGAALEKDANILMFAPTASNSESDFTNVYTNQTGVLTQQFGYIEVPLEIDYKLYQKRFGLSVITGFSAMFLTGNSLDLVVESDRTESIGGVSNLNSVNASTNLGFGLNYGLTPKIQFTVEPILKYQLNTYSNNNGAIKPFSMGVYSGINYKF